MIIYGTVILMLALFGLHKYYLLYLFWKYRNRPGIEPGEFETLPKVTVQLPIFNEKYVIERLIKTVCALEYPKELLEIQVLDDSTDETQNEAKYWTNFFRKKGFNVHYFHRDNRTGFKAGALEEGLKKAEGELIAIFDADFVPKSDFLKKTVPYFVNEKVGMVQARWGHINQNYSFLTQIQSVFLDGHFVIEHTARNRSGRFFNFNGTAGMWRKKAIESAGGWQHDTLTEDLDLSYRAQIAGWKFVFLPDVIAPAELPVVMNAFKSQQHRWAKGSIQTAKKLLPRIFKSNLPLKVKWEALVHLVSNFSYLLMVIPSIFILPITIIQFNNEWNRFILVYLLLFFSATVSVFLFYLVCQRTVYPDWLKRLRYIPGMMAFGIGLSINNSKAVLEALFNYRTEFKRTPKYRIEKKRDHWRNKIYSAEKNYLPFLEFVIGVYFSFTVYFAVKNQVYLSIPFFLLFQFGFLYISLMSFLQIRKGV
jgi:cellulose synthase/poly-beta-1,6-N-acetylglucosamine synthase-like glycosyltransferase